jgi:hypothetical protein
MAKPKIFQFKSRGIKKVKLEQRLKDFIEAPAEPPMGLIHGQEPDSQEEWRVALALNRLGLNYYYQFSVGGGRFTKGGQVVDFWVMTVPLPTPLFVQGEYCHSGTKAAETKLKLAQIQRIFNGQCNTPVEIWDYEIPTVDAAYQVVKARLA